MDSKDLVLYIIQIITFILLIFSEYLGFTPKYKSNAILQMLICALTPKEEPPVVPTIIEQAPERTTSM